MNLIIKNGLTTKKIYDENNNLIYKIRNKNIFKPNKLMFSYENRLLYNTDIVDNTSSAIKKSWNTAESRKYVMYKADNKNEIIATATFDYASHIDRTIFHKLLFKAPQINKLTINSIWGTFTIKLLRNYSCLILDKNAKEIAIISSYHPLKGWKIEYNSLIDTNCLCGLFLLSQYMIHEQDLLTI